jgi:hypothetical protein
MTTAARGGAALTEERFPTVSVGRPHQTHISRGPINLQEQAPAFALINDKKEKRAGTGARPLRYLRQAGALRIDLFYPCSR